MPKQYQKPLILLGKHLGIEVYECEMGGLEPPKGRSNGTVYAIKNAAGEVRYIGVYERNSLEVKRARLLTAMNGMRSPLGAFLRESGGMFTLESLESEIRGNPYKVKRKWVEHYTAKGADLLNNKRESA